MSCLDYFSIVESMLAEVKSSGRAEISSAADLVARTVMAGGIVQAFGSGHSYAGAIEISRRAGGLIPVKCLDEPSKGRYEAVEGVGAAYMAECDVRPNDLFIIISNTGINPLPVEIAMAARGVGCRVIAVTALEVSRSMASRHSSGKKLYQLADVVLDNRGVFGDAAVAVEGLPCKVCGTSSVMTALLLNGTMLEAIELMTSRGFSPPVFRSGNVEGGMEYDRQQVMKYIDRLFRNHVYY